MRVLWIVQWAKVGHRAAKKIVGEGNDLKAGYVRGALRLSPMLLGASLLMKFIAGYGG